MPEVTIVYWRDIPAQVIVGKGRRGVKVKPLTERFEQAIDRAAMKIGAAGMPTPIWPNGARPNPTASRARTRRLRQPKPPASIPNMTKSASRR